MVAPGCGERAGVLLTFAVSLVAGVAALLFVFLRSVLPPSASPPPLAGPAPPPAVVLLSPPFGAPSNTCICALAVPDNF